MGADVVVPNRITVDSVVLNDRGKAVELMPAVKKLSRALAETAPDHVDYQDVVASGLLGLVTAQRHFKPSARTKLSSYAFTRIAGEIKDMLRRERIYANRYLPTDVFEEGDTLARSVSFESAVLERDLFLKVCQVVSELPAVQAYIIVQFYLEGQPVVRIAKALRISSNAVNQLRDKGIASVRARFPFYCRK